MKKRLLSSLLVLYMALALLPSLSLQAEAASFPNAYRKVVQDIVNKYGVFSANNSNDFSKNTGIINAFTADLTNDGEEELCVFYMKPSGTSDDGIISEIYTLSNGVAKRVFEHRTFRGSVFSFGVYESKPENYFSQSEDRYTSSTYVWRDGKFITADMSKMTQKQKDYLAENSAANVGYFAESRARDKVQLEILGLREGTFSEGFGIAEPWKWNSSSVRKTLASMGVSLIPTDIFVTVNGAVIQWTDAVPFMSNGRTMVPLRAIGEALGLTVDWDNKTREAIFTNGAKTIYFPIDKTTARTEDGQSIQMDTAAVLKGGRTYAPVRYLAEYFGFTVGWDGTTRTVSIQ